MNAGPWVVTRCVTDISPFTSSHSKQIKLKWNNNNNNKGGYLTHMPASYLQVCEGTLLFHIVIECAQVKSEVTLCQI